MKHMLDILSENKCESCFHFIYDCILAIFPEPETVADLKEEKNDRSPISLKVSWTQPKGGLTHYQLQITPNDGEETDTGLKVDR